MGIVFIGNHHTFAILITSLRLFIRQRKTFSYFEDRQKSTTGAWLSVEVLKAALSLRGRTQEAALLSVQRCNNGGTNAIITGTLSRGKVTQSHCGSEQRRRRWRGDGGIPILSINRFPLPRAENPLRFEIAFLRPLWHFECAPS